MTDPIEEEQRALEQEETARTLLDLICTMIKHQLPVPSWSISRFRPNLDAHLTAFRRGPDREMVEDDETSIANVRAWATLFHLPVLIERYTNYPNSGEVCVRAKNNSGVHVCIWAHITPDDRNLGERKA